MNKEMLTQTQKEFLQKVNPYAYSDSENGLTYKTVYTETYDIEKRFGINLTVVTCNELTEGFMYYHFAGTNMTLFDKNKDDFFEKINNAVSKFAGENDLVATERGIFGCFFEKNREAETVKEMVEKVIDFQKSIDRKLPDIDSVSKDIRYFIENDIPAAEWLPEEYLSEKTFWTPYVDLNNRVIAVDVSKESDGVFSIFAASDHIDDFDEEGIPHDLAEIIIGEIRSEIGVGGEFSEIAFYDVSDLTKISEYVELICQAVLMFQNRWLHKEDLQCIKKYLNLSDNSNNEKPELSGIVETEKYTWFADPSDSWLGLTNGKTVEEFGEPEEMYARLRKFAEGKDKLLFIKTNKKDVFGTPISFIVDKHFPDDPAFKKFPEFWTSELEEKPCYICSSSLQTWDFSIETDLEEVVGMLSSFAKKYNIENNDFVYEDIIKKNVISGMPEVSCQFGIDDDIEDIVSRIFSCILEFQKTWRDKHENRELPAQQDPSPVVPDERHCSIDEIFSWYKSASSYDSIILDTAYMNYDNEQMSFKVTKTPFDGGIQIETSRKDVENFFFVTNSSGRVTDLLRSVAEKYGAQVIDDIDGYRLGLTTEINKAPSGSAILSVCLLEFQRLSQTL